ncbi:MAG: hypothetical protein WCH39_27980, partial [Schlesneria sp.]
NTRPPPADACNGKEKNGTNGTLWDLWDWMRTIVPSLSHRSYLSHKSHERQPPKAENLARLFRQKNSQDEVPPAPETVVKGPLP